MWPVASSRTQEYHLFVVCICITWTKTYKSEFSILTLWDHHLNGRFYPSESNWAQVRSNSKTRLGQDCWSKSSFRNVREESFNSWLMLVEGLQTSVCQFASALFYYPEPVWLLSQTAKLQQSASWSSWPIFMQSKKASKLIKPQSAQWYRFICKDLIASFLLIYFLIRHASSAGSSKFMIRTCVSFLSPRWNWPPLTNKIHSEHVSQSWPDKGVYMRPHMLWKAKNASGWFSRTLRCYQNGRIVCFGFSIELHPIPVQSPQFWWPIWAQKKTLNKSNQDKEWCLDTAYQCRAYILHQNVVLRPAMRPLFLGLLWKLFPLLFTYPGCLAAHLLDSLGHWVLKNHN